MNIEEGNIFTGKRIKSYRKKMKITQQELAKKIGVKGNSISAYERGVVEIPRSKLLAIAEALDIHYNELLPIVEKSEKDTISEYVNHAKSELNDGQLKFLEDLIEKTLSLNEQERENFLKNIKLAVKFYNEN